MGGSIVIWSYNIVLLIHRLLTIARYYDILNYDIIILFDHMMLRFCLITIFDDLFTTMGVSTCPCSLRTTHLGCLYIPILNFFVLLCHLDIFSTGPAYPNR